MLTGRAPWWRPAGPWLPALSQPLSCRLRVCPPGPRLPLPPLLLPRLPLGSPHWVPGALPSDFDTHSFELSSKSGLPAATLRPHTPRSTFGNQLLLATSTKLPRPEPPAPRPELLAQPLSPIPASSQHGSQGSSDEIIPLLNTSSWHKPSACRWPQGPPGSHPGQL